MALQSKTQRVLLFGFIASICSCGLVGIYVFAAGDFGNLEARILGTTILVAGIFLMGLLAAIPTARRTWHPLGPIAMATLPFPLVLTLMLIWMDYLSSYDYRYYRELETWIATSWTVSSTACVIALLSLARLKQQWLWILGATVTSGILFCLLILFVIHFEVDDDSMTRIIGINAIATVCGVITVPILHRLSAIPTVERVITSKVEVSLTCPRCNKAQVMTVGGSECNGCKLKINIEIEEDLCRKCGYVLYKLESANCPECGTPILPQHPTAASEHIDPVA